MGRDWGPIFAQTFSGSRFPPGRERGGLYSIHASYAFFNVFSYVSQVISYVLYVQIKSVNSFRVV